MERRQYDISVVVNGKELSFLVIDPHYLKKHKGSVTDEIIIELVKMLDGGEFVPEKMSADGYEYYVEDRMVLKGKTYKLIWLLKDDEIYIGVVNCYRRK
jgi:hypothetical protein